MAFGVYYRKSGTRNYLRAHEWVEPTRKAINTHNGKVARDIRCETLEDAKELELRYINRGYETKIKEVK